MINRLYVNQSMDISDDFFKLPPNVTCVPDPVSDRWWCRLGVCVCVGGGGGQETEKGERYGKGQRQRRLGGWGGIVPVYCRPKYFCMYFLDLSAVPCKLQATRLCICMGGGGGHLLQQMSLQKITVLETAN